MSRFIFLTLLLAFIGFTSAQVGQINTPSDKIANGANTVITWTYTPIQNQMPGILSCIDNTTKNTTVLNNAIDLSTKSYKWTVNMPAGSYYLSLNDGSGDKYSGTFSVFDAGQSTPVSALTSDQTQNGTLTATHTQSPAVAAASSSHSASTSQHSSATSFTKSYKILFSLTMIATVMVHFF